MTSFGHILQCCLRLDICANHRYSFSGIHGHDSISFPKYDGALRLLFILGPTRSDGTELSPVTALVKMIEFWANRPLDERLLRFRWSGNERMEDFSFVDDSLIQCVCRKATPVRGKLEHKRYVLTVLTRYSLRALGTEIPLP